MTNGSTTSKRLYVLVVLLMLITAGNFIYIVFNWDSGREFQSIVGPSGPRGDAGIPGLQGPRGDIGLQGVQGPQGPQGAPGVQGASGPQGPAGRDGLDGLDGLAGADGLPGKDGAQGPAGTDGREIELRGNNETDTIEWRYAGEDDTSWRVLVRYCDLTNSCAVEDVE